MQAISRKGSHLNEPLGNYISHQINNNSLRIETDNSRVSITLYHAGIFRIRISRPDAEYCGFSYAVNKQPLEHTRWDVSEDAKWFTLQTSVMSVKIQKFPLRIEAFDSAGNLLCADDPAFGTSWLGQEVTTYKSLQPDERFIGLGEKTGPLDRRGNAYVNWNTDNFAYAVDADPIYMSTPFYMGIHGKVVYGIFFDNSYKTTFNFGCSNKRFSYFQAEDGEMDYYLIHADNVAGILENYTWLTGRMELPPLWSLGFQQCRYSYYPYTEVLNAARTFREKKIPADVLYLDIHYMDAYKVFTWHPERFPDPKGLLDELKGMGFKVVVILDPGVKTEAGYTTYEEGVAKGMFVKYPDGSEYNGQVWPGWSAFPDFTLEAVRSWWGEQMKVLTDKGIEGFWNDMNEPAAWGQHLPDLIEFGYEGETATHKRARNVYGMQMARSTFEGAKKLLPGKRPFVLTRAGYCGIQRYAAAWTGDNVSTDEHMLAGTRLINSLGLTGVSFSGNDVGGFAGEASPDLFARWIALGAFSPFFRSHSMVNSRDSEPWSFGEEVEDISRNYIKLRYRLIPYLYALFYESTQTGMPIARSLAIDYTFDSHIYQDAYQNQFMFGPAMLVIPFESNKTFHKAYLPEGSWYNLYTDALHEGSSELVIEASKEVLPVFVKSGSIVLMQEAVESLQLEASAETLEVHVYTGADGSFISYKDDGSSYEYQKGYYTKRQYNLQGNTLTIGKAEGQWQPQYKQMVIFLHGLPASVMVKVNGIDNAITEGPYRFIEPISDFDPYHKPPKAPVQIENLTKIHLPYRLDATHVQWFTK
ncbi:MAG: DUF4968 domain-containing protein [Bacteroidia bacterium]|nr:DUF4968 domain-containing protein [Bacteroidia bacterium]MCC6769393.1 DUF4968 domain-containing protein [Bacteroidia bacterium]